MRTRPPMFGLGMLFLLLAAALMSISHAGAEVRLESAASRVPVDKLFVVDCLLPGQVRQLGTRMTYLSPRRAIKTSAGECELRGGEYVASDRGSLNAALAIWLIQLACHHVVQH